MHLLFDVPPTTWREAFNRWALAARNAPVIVVYLEDISRSRGDIAVAAFDASWTSWRGRPIEPHVNEALLM